MGNRELDAAVALEVMAWPRVGLREPYRHHVHRGGVVVERDGWLKPEKFSVGGGIPASWSPSTDIAAAWAVVERLRGLGWAFHLDDGHAPERPWGAYFEGPDDDYRTGDGATAPEAICLAALAAVRGGREP